MRMRTLIATAVAGVTLAAGVGTSVSAQDAPAPTLADILAAQGGIGDRNWYDFDIVAGVVTAILTNDAADGDSNGDGDPKDSPLWLAADPNSPKLTVFLPNDRAFQALAADVLGWRYWFANEATVAQGLLGAFDLPTLEFVVSYHVYAGELSPIASSTALSVPKGTPLTMLAGGDIRVTPVKWLGTAILADNDPNDINATLVKSKLDIQASNGVAHGISFVLRPVDL
jgi:uncharacterized surface protein with fasciclin (FAS1) repeats